MNTILHTKDTMSDIYLDAVKIRFQVFVEEQQVPLDLEIDAYEAVCIHFVLYDKNKQPLATARLRQEDASTVGKIERMAVCKASRKKGLGREVITEIEQVAKELCFTSLTLHAQLTAKPFYETLGFTAFGEHFLDAGIEHVAMTKDF